MARGSRGPTIITGRMMLLVAAGLAVGRPLMGPISTAKTSRPIMRLVLDSRGHGRDALPIKRPTRSPQTTCRRATCSTAETCTSMLISHPVCPTYGGRQRAVVVGLSHRHCSTTSAISSMGRSPYTRGCSQHHHQLETRCIWQTSR